MARHFSTQKNRSKTTSSPQQRIISQYFTPRSGISKDEVNFLVKANPSSQKNKNTHRTTAVLGRTDQITFTPALGFTTATHIHQQSGGCYSGTENQQILSAGHRNLLGSTTCKCAVSGHVSCACSALQNGTAEEKQTHFDNTLALGIMASSASSSSSSSSSSSQSPRNTRRTRRSNLRAQNHIIGRPGSVKKQKRVPKTITVDSEDDNCLRDDCCVITSVSCGRKINSNSEAEESSGSSQSFTSMESTFSSQGSKRESSYKCSSSCESDQKNTASLSKKSSLSSKSVRQTKEQASAKSTFGLVGGSVSDSDDDDDSQDLSQCESNFAQLPVEIMENIFCQLPIVDLMLNCALVCHQWCDIISRDSVMVFF